MIRLSIDLDGVLFNFIQNAISVANTALNRDIPLDYEPDDWEWTKIFTKSDWEKTWEAIEKTPNFWLREAPYVNNVNCLYAYQFLNGYSENYFITSRVSTCGDSPEDQSTQALNGHGIQGKVIVVNDPSYKARWMKDLYIDYSIDDYPPTVAACNRIEGHKAFLHDRPWNRDVKLPRVYSIGEFLEKTFHG